jgi:hypothetical protein
LEAFLGAEVTLVFALARGEGLVEVAVGAGEGVLADAGVGALVGAHLGLVGLAVLGGETGVPGAHAGL